jgi:flagellar motor switch protein FliM
MHKSGLIALAETYGLDRRELQQLKLVAEAFFEALRTELSSSIATPIKLSGLVQTVASFKDACAGAPHGRQIFLGTPARVAALIRTDAAFARAIVDCLIAGKTSQTQDADPRALTAIEDRLFLNTMAMACVRASRTLAARPVTGGELRRLEPALAENISDPAENFGLAAITCHLGSASATLELALPLARFSLPIAHPLPASAQEAMSAESKARTLLAHASAELVAVLGQTRMPLDAVRALGPGSILALRRLKDGLPEVELRCGPQVLFSGAVVEHRGWRRFVIRHTGVADERTEEPGLDA